GLVILGRDPYQRDLVAVDGHLALDQCAVVHLADAIARQRGFDCGRRLRQDRRHIERSRRARTLRGRAGLDQGGPRLVSEVLRGGIGPRRHRLSFAEPWLLPRPRSYRESDADHEAGHVVEGWSLVPRRAKHQFRKALSAGHIDTGRCSMASCFGRAKGGTPRHRVSHQRVHGWEFDAEGRQFHPWNWSIGIATEQRVQPRGVGTALLPECDDFFGHHGDRDLRLQYILLRRLTHFVARGGDGEEIAQQVAIALQDYQRTVGRGDGEVALEDSCQEHRLDFRGIVHLGECPRCRFPSHGSARAGPWYVLTELDLVHRHRLVGAKTVDRPIHQPERQHRVREGAGTRHPLGGGSGTAPRGGQ